MPNDERRNRSKDAHDAKAREPLFHTRPMPVAALGLLCGLIAGAYLHIGAVWIVVGAALGSCALLLRMKRSMLALFVALAALGACRIALARPPALPEGKGTLSGVVAAEPDDYGETQRVLLKELSWNGAAYAGRAYLYAPFRRMPACGDTVTASVRMESPALERRFYAYARGVSANAYSYAPAQLARGDGGGAAGALIRIRDLIGARIDELFPDAGGAAKGMLLGDTDDVSQLDTDAFRRAGVSHLFAVSGLHVSILAGAFSMLFRRSAWVRFAATALFLAAYALLTACTPSVLRAAVMLLVYQLAPLLNRRRDPISSLSFAFILVLLYQPYAVFLASFQLSFCAVFGLNLLAAPIRSRLWRLGSVGAGLVASSAAVVVATLPAACLCFGEAQLLSLATNLFVLPVAAVFLVPAFLGVALSFACYPLGSAICIPARITLAYIQRLTLVVGELPLSIPAPNPIAYALYMTAILLGSRLLLRSGRTRLRLSIVAFALSFVVWTL